MPESDKGELILRQWEVLRPHDQPGRSAQELVEALELRGFAVTLTLPRFLGPLSLLPLEHCGGRDEQDYPTKIHRRVP